jgi:hypothetical protein
MGQTSGLDILPTEKAFQKINRENATGKGISNIGCIIKANAHANL